MYYLRFLLLLIINVPIAALAGENAAWPCFHGPQRNNLSTDTGLMQAWPQNGPELLWTTSGIGHGYSSVAIAGDRIFTAGMIDKQTYVTPRLLVEDKSGVSTDSPGKPPRNNLGQFRIQAPGAHRLWTASLFTTCLSWDD